MIEIGVLVALFAVAVTSILVMIALEDGEE